MKKIKKYWQIKYFVSQKEKKMSIISSVLSVAEGFVAWFLSWAIWNPQFTLASVKNMWNTEKQAFLNIVLFFRGLVEENGVSNITIPIAIAGMITMAVVLTIFIVGAIAQGAILLFFLSPLGFTATVTVVYWLRKVNGKKFLKRIIWAFVETWKEEKRKNRKRKIRVISGKKR